MATGPEMLLGTLIKVFGLEPEVEKLRGMAKQAADEDLLGQAKEALAIVRGFDERLKGIERALGIETSSSSGVQRPRPRLVGDDTPQLDNGTGFQRPGSVGVSRDHADGTGP